ncbi:MAG: class I SAM-dependent methyltransferase [Streptosporangiaceae bacterium]
MPCRARAVLAFKEAVLRGQGAAPRCERITVPADLREDWAAAVTGAGLDTGDGSGHDRPRRGTRTRSCGAAVRRGLPPSSGGTAGARAQLSSRSVLAASST